MNQQIELSLKEALLEIDQGPDKTPSYENRRNDYALKTMPTNAKKKTL